MDNFLKYFLVASALSSCSYIDLGNCIREGGGTEPLWSTAVVYPDGYDWKADTLWGEIPSLLVLMRDTSRILSLEVSESNAVSADAGDHFILDGHLFTCRSETAGASGGGGSTIIKRDGTQIARFASRETVDYIEETAEGILTLGSGRDGGALTLRLDGRALLHEDNASPLGDAHKDDGQVCFCYVRHGVAADGNDGKTYVCVENGVARGAAIPEGASGILCGRRLDGEWNFICTESDGKSLLWARGEEKKHIGAQWTEIRSAALEKVGDELLCRIQVKLRSGKEFQWNDCFYKWGGIITRTKAAAQVYSFCHDTPVLYYACSDNGGKGPISICRNGATSALDPRYVMYSPYAFALSASRKGAIGLNDLRASSAPVIIHGSDTLRFSFNGYFTRINLQ